MRRAWDSATGRAAIVCGALVAGFYSPVFGGLLAAWRRSKEDWDSTEHANDMYGMGDPSIWFGLLVFVTATVAICVAGTIGFAVAHRGEARVGFGRFVVAAFLSGSYGAIGVAAIGVAADTLRGPVLPLVGIPVVAAVTGALVVRSVPVAVPQMLREEGDGAVP